MRIRINGREIQQPVNKVTIQQSEVSDVVAWGVVLIGILAIVGWWRLWL